MSHSVDAQGILYDADVLVLALVGLMEWHGGEPLLGGRIAALKEAALRIRDDLQILIDEEEREAAARKAAA